MIHRTLIAAATAGLIALDVTGWGPWMLSQPVVCGPLFGMLFGNMAAGLIVGGIVQLLWMDVSPVGVGIPFDSAATTILAVFWATVQPHASLSQIVLSLFIAVPMGFVFRAMDQHARRLNIYFVRRMDAVPDNRLPAALSLGMGLAFVWSWFRYALLYFVVMWAGEEFWRFLNYIPKMTWLDRGLTMAALVLPVAGMGVTLELFMSEEPEGRWMAFRARRTPKGKGADA